MKPAGPLPHSDHKPVGAADFYFGINATFRFVERKFGIEGLRKYWTDLGRHYFAPVARGWQAGGPPAVAEYWQAFFAAEPAADVNVSRAGDQVVVDVKVCPALHHLRTHQREVVASFCQHCYFINEAIAGSAGMTARVEGGNGACRQTFQPLAAGTAAQDLARIKAATC